MKLHVEPLAQPEWFSAAAAGLTGAGVRVAIVDSGWDHGLEVPGLRVEPGVALPQGGDTQDGVGHGTACMLMIHRYAPGAALCPVKIFHDRLAATAAELAQAIEWCVQRRFHLVHLSLSSTAPEAAPVLYRACATALAADVIVVAANEKKTCFPAAFDNVLSVGLAPYLPAFDYDYRPGEQVECWTGTGLDGRVLGLGGEALEAFGVSFAAPRITGLLALLIEREGRIGVKRARALLQEYSVSARRLSGYR